MTEQAVLSVVIYASIGYRPSHTKAILTFFSLALSRLVPSCFINSHAEAGSLVATCDWSSALCYGRGLHNPFCRPSPPLQVSGCGHLNCSWP
ncbi:hypothetical protein RRG08_002365 [Elysia crispata]|uniref:Uncharacterized protein n=1 Tax=Elysia crispata TaxID=231223 RepID=A0AAE1EA16_9GAST|nr:hypothetical protein RRG08_002365 [Elysia crispata]